MATVKKPTAKEIWDTLSKVDVDVKWHGQRDDAGIMHDIQVYPGGSSMVNCSVTIGDVTRDMWLPVMDYRHKAIANADSRSISDARMRCLTKCFALFGLGHYIYAGEDTPGSWESGAHGASPVSSETAHAHPKKAVKKAPKKKAPKKEAKKEVEENYIKQLTTAATDLFNSGWEPDVNLKFEISTAIKNDDNEEAVRLIKILKEAGKTVVKLNNEEEQNDG